MEPLPLAAYEVSGSWEMAGAGGPVAVCLSAFGEQVRWVLVRLGAPRGQGFFVGHKNAAATQGFVHGITSAILLVAAVLGRRSCLET